MPRQAGTALVLGLLATALPAAAQEPVNVPYTKYVLDNGLRLIMHEDHKRRSSPSTSGMTSGAADEAPGKTAYARACRSSASTHRSKSGHTPRTVSRPICSKAVGPISGF